MSVGDFPFLFPKDTFRALVGKGYRTLQSLLLDICQWLPSDGLLNALLDMLVDGMFDIKTRSVIKVILLILCHNYCLLNRKIISDCILLVSILHTCCSF